MIKVRFLVDGCIVKGFLFLVLFFIFGLDGYSQAISKTPFSYSFTTDDYYGGIQNWQIQQSTDGFIYVANNYGLMEFDGEDWKTYEIEDGTRSISLYIDPDNKIYIGGQNQMGYFKKDPLGNLNYMSIVNLLPEDQRNIDNIWRIIPYKGNILFNNNLNLYEYTGEEVITYPFPRDGGFMFSAGPRVFVYSPSDGLLEWENKTFIKLENDKRTLNSSVVSILPFQNQSYLIFQSNGEIFLLENKKITPWNKKIVDLLKHSLINSAKRLNDNRFAIATQNSGVIIMTMEGTFDQHLCNGEGITDNTVYSLFEDSFNNLWVGMNNGVSCIELSSPFSLINESIGVPGTGYAAELVDDQLYLGTNNGVFQQVNSSFSLGSRAYDLVRGTEGQIYNISETGGIITVGSHRGGFRIEENEAYPIYTNTGVWMFKKTPNENKLIAGTYNGFFIYDPQNGSIKNLRGFNESSRLFEFKNDSTLWMSHGFKGVYKIAFDKSYEEINQISFYGEKKGFPSNILINLFRLSNLNVFPAEYGIYTYDESFDLFSPYEELEQYFGKYSHLSALNMDSQGNLYYIADGNFGVLRKNRFNTYDDLSTPFRKINKYISDDLENIHILNHENILIGAKEGFIHYNPLVPIREEKDFNTYIRSVLVTFENDSVAVLGTLTNGFEYTFYEDVKSLKFRYSSPYFDGFDETKYQYKLENFEKEWSEWQDENQKEYTNLSYGTYTFHVRSKNIYNQESQVVSFTFTLTPPWYFSSAAFVIYILVVLILFGFSLYLLDSKHRFDKRKMVINQKREIQRKDVELEEFERKSEEAITQLKNEKLKSEIEFKNRELTSTTMHLINKNEFMLGVKSRLKSLTKNGTLKKDEIHRIIRTIDKNIAEDEGWDHFTRHFDQVHGDFLKKLKRKYPNLTPQETKLSAYLKMNLNTKEIAQLLNISVRGVEVSRYRLRKKLDIDRNTNLTTFMMNL